MGAGYRASYLFDTISTIDDEYLHSLQLMDTSKAYDTLLKLKGVGNKVAECILLFGFVITLELMNTAIETAIDICMPEINPKAKLAKDTSAGAVLVVAIVSVVIGIMIFGPKLLEIWRNL